MPNQAGAPNPHGAPNPQGSPNQPDNANLQGAQQPYHYGYQPNANPGGGAGQNFQQPYSPKAPQNDGKEKLTARTWWVILWLIIFWPLGLFFMWKNKKWPLVARIIITVVIGILFVIGIVSATGDGSTDTSTPTVEAGASDSDESTPAADTSTESVSQEYKNALSKAETYSEMMHMSKAGIYDQLTSEYGEGFSADAAQYAVDNVKADWKANALKKAETYYKDMSMSKSAVYDQLISEYGEQFTAEEAQYAIDNLK